MTFITLIPKSENSESTSHFRPIGLCNVCYKIIAMILDNRVKHLLNTIISLLQWTFSLERLINDNIMLAHEIMHPFKKKKGKIGYMVVKFNMEKTYDRLEWDFTRTIMSKIRLPFQMDWMGYEIHFHGFLLLINKWNLKRENSAIKSY